MRREEVVGGGMGAIKATSANGWTRREKVEGADAWARSEQAEGRDIGPGKVSRNIRVSTGGFYGTTRSSFLMEVPMEPKVNIIVPVYNAEKSLARCVDSILNQEFRDFELILMDDGSKDRSGEICDGYARADARVVVVHKENTGVSDTRNQAIARARGTFLQFVDSDDWLTADATKLMVRAAEETGCDMVIADFYRVVGEMVSQKGDIDADQVIGREAFVGFMMENPADYYYGVLWNKLYRRSLVEAHGIRMDAKLSWCEDFLFNLEYVRYASTFYALRTPVYYYVKTKGSLVNQKISFARTVEMKLAMFECYNDFFKHVLDEEAYERKRLQVYHFLVDAAKDGFVFPATIPGTQKLGEERSQALQEVISEDGIIVEKYRDRKLLERYLESVALKYDMTMAELSLLLYRKDAGKALTRGAEAQMPAREDAVEATDRKDAGKALSRKDNWKAADGKDAGKALSRKDLAELMHMSRGDLRAALQKLVTRGMLEVVDVPRKRRDAAEIAEATGLFGKRGEAQDADADGMTKKKREPRKIRLELLPASDAVLQDIAAAERDYEQAKFRGFTEDELRQYTALERRVQENEKQILQK